MDIKYHHTSLLKSCPFCNSSVSHVQELPPYPDAEVAEFFELTRWMVQCGGCSCVGPPQPDMAAAVNNWNRCGRQAGEIARSEVNRELERIRDAFNWAVHDLMKPKGRVA